MSQAPHENIDISNPGLNPGDTQQGPQYPPRSAQNQELRGISDHVDGSGPIFSLYLEMAAEEDKKLAESWKDDADGILIFTGLFSAAVASLISVSIQDLRQNPQDISNFYLANTYQATINPNASSSLPASPPPFTPPNYAIWVNALWFLSLVISITCALLATLLQQWARRYLKVTQPRYSPHKRARIRAFFAEGVDKFLLPWAVEALPAMLHLSLFLFFAGLAVFLWNVNLTIFKLVLSWIGLCTALYGCITFIPVFRHDSPYHTPLSLPVWHFVTGIQFLMFRALQKITYSRWFGGRTYNRFRRLAGRHGRLLVRGMQNMAETSALRSPSEIDTRAFMWTLNCLDEDHELERFFSGLPGFRGSKMVKDPVPDLTSQQQRKLLNTWFDLLYRTFSSDLLPTPVKERRGLICAKMVGPAGVPGAIQSLTWSIVSEDRYGPVQSAIAHSVGCRGNGGDEKTTMVIRAIVSSVIARAQRRDDLWFAMAADAMSLPESVLRNHATHGKNLSLAILIHVVRQQFSLYWEPHWPKYYFWKVLEAASKFDVLDTSPELQHEFCELWNEVVRASHGGMPWEILRPIRNVYLTLHQHTDSAPTAFSASTGDEDRRILSLLSTYPLCDIPGHHPDSVTHIHDVSASTAVPHSVLNDNAALVPTFPPDALSPFVTVPVHVDENSIDMPLLDNIPVPAPLYSAHQMATESIRNSATSPDLVAAAATRDNPSARTMAPTIRETSTSTSFVPPPAVVSSQSNADLMAHSGAPKIPSSASPASEPVFDNILPTEFHSSIMASTSPRTSPLPTSAPELAAAVGVEGSPKADSREDKDAIDLPPVDRASGTNTIGIVDLVPQLVPLPPVTDIPIASPSQQEFDAGHTTDPPPNTLDGQYDTV